MARKVIREPGSPDECLEPLKFDEPIGTWLAEPIKASGMRKRRVHRPDTRPY